MANKVVGIRDHWRRFSFHGHRRRIIPSALTSLRGRLRTSKLWNNARQLSWIVIIIGFIAWLIGMAGLIHGPVPYLPIPGLPEFHSRISPTMFGIGISILVIDTASAFRGIQLEKRRLVQELCSKDSSTVIRAVDNLHFKGWLYDGTLGHAKLLNADLTSLNLTAANLEYVTLAGATLKGADLTGASLKRAYISGSLSMQMPKLDGYGIVLVMTKHKRGHFSRTEANKPRKPQVGEDWANLEHTILREANLKNAIVSEISLRQAHALKGATMPDGSRYNGRYSLKGDIEDAEETILNTADEELMAYYYGVPLEIYVARKSQGEWESDVIQQA